MGQLGEHGGLWPSSLHWAPGLFFFYPVFSPHLGSFYNRASPPHREEAEEDKDCLCSIMFSLSSFSFAIYFSTFILGPGSVDARTG